MFKIFENRPNIDVFNFSIFSIFLEEMQGEIS